MAEAPGHRLGQIVGEALEAAVYPLLRDFASSRSLYLDHQGPRKARPGNKLTWTDDLGNAHDLDFVLERGGSDERIGVPVAFIESAWRRYTKHSRNKAQEVQGALLPLRERYRQYSPVLVALLAGRFTLGSLNQLRSNGFVVMYIPESDVAQCFAKAGIDIAGGENTPDAVLAKQVAKFEELSPADREAIGAEIRESNSKEFDQLISRLAETVARRIESIVVLPLHGSSSSFSRLEDAIEAVKSYGRGQEAGPFVRFDITIRYTNGDSIVASFSETGDALSFLGSFAQP